MLGAADTGPIAILADHVHMIKFGSREATGYEKISGHLQLVTLESSSAIKLRLQE